MEGRVKVNCALIGFFGLLSVVLGFAAEATRIQMDDNGKCIPTHRKSPASALGKAALKAIIVSEIITSVTTGCICCCRRGPQPTSICNWIVGGVCFVLSWFAIIIAAIMLSLGSMSNKIDETTIACNSGSFGIGAIFSLVTLVLGLVSYILSLERNNNNPRQGGIAMAQPQLAEASLYITQEPRYTAVSQDPASPI